MKSIDVNVDIGEGFGFDDALLELATSANICCGEHAGSVLLAAETVEKCRVKGVRIGAHPGFPDRASTGRNAPTEEQEESWYRSVVRQVETFVAVNPNTAYIKPHGAWYNLIVDGNQRARTALLMAQAFSELRPVMMLPQARLLQMVIKEGFPERGYYVNGYLIPRSEPGALLHDDAEIATQAVRLAKHCDSLCVHGDSPGCVHKLETVVRALVNAGYRVGHGL